MKNYCVYYKNELFDYYETFEDARENTKHLKGITTICGLHLIENRLKIKSKITFKNQYYGNSRIEKRN